MRDANIMWPAHLALGLVLLLSTPAVVGAEPIPGWRLAFRMTTTTEKVGAAPSDTKTDTKSAAGKPEVAHSEMIARLDANWLSIEQDGTETLYDFPARRQYVVHRAAETRSETSLFADIGFREYEMKNRVYLAQMLEAAMSKAGKAEKVGPENPMDILGVECKFGIEAAPAAVANLEESTVDGVREFRLRGQLSARYRAAEEELPRSLRPALRRLLAYGASLHPRIASRLDSVAAPPILLEYRVVDMTTRRTVLLELTASAAESTDWKARLAGLVRESSERAPAGDLPTRVLDGRLEGSAPTFDDYRRSSAKALEAKDYLDAMLALFEANLATGKEDSRGIGEILEAGADDTRLSILLRGLESDDPKESLRLFDSIDLAGVRRRHVIDVFRANSLAETGDPAGAVDAFRKAITANPYLAGAYKDLGGVLYGMYEVPSAWDCWDAGRKIAPGHPLFEDVAKTEDRLLRQSPRFF